jgi:hypothetical protein
MPETLMVSRYRRGFAMDFVERWFGIFPDGGDGTFEAALVFAAAVVVGLACLAGLIRRSIARRGRPERPRA